MREDNPVVPSLRDLRDPQKLGEALLHAMEAGRKLGWTKLSSAATTLDRYDIPDVSKDDSMGKQCVADYLAELEAGAAAGDKYSKAALDRLYSALPADHPEHP